MHPTWAADRGLLTRFDSEAKALARVKHAGVVQVFDTGNESGPPYIAMEFVPGGTLAQRVKAGPLPPREAATIMAAVAEAVAAAHAENLLHRDIKSGNILLDADGKPKVTDFGLAKFTGAPDGPTLSGAVLGTPSYMAPEQAAGKTSAIDVRTDVYGLGATLYELLTGRPPFKGADQAATLLMVLTDELVPPRSLRPDVPADLEAVCLKCLDKDPRQRYPSAAAVAAELRRWLDEGRTEVRPRTRWGKARRWAGRHRLKLIIAALVPLVTAAVAVSDPKRQIEWTLALGRPVTLVGEKGMPRYHRWELDEVQLTLPSGADGAPGFQSLTLSMLELAPDTGSDRYRLSAEIKHVSGSDPVSCVGIYLGPTSAITPYGLRIARWYGFQFTENPHEVVLDPGLDGRDYLTIHSVPRSDTAAVTLGPTFPFAPARSWTNLTWRRIVFDVSPESVVVYWRTPEGALVEANPSPASSRALADTSLRKMFGPPNDPRGLPIPAWSPRGPVGVYAKKAGIAFRNVSIEPLPSAPPP